MKNFVINSKVPKLLKTVQYLYCVRYILAFQGVKRGNVCSLFMTPQNSYVKTTSTMKGVQAL